MQGGFEREKNNRCRAGRRSEARLTQYRQSAEHKGHQSGNRTGRAEIFFITAFKPMKEKGDACKSEERKAEEER